MPWPHLIADLLWAKPQPWLTAAKSTAQAAITQAISQRPQAKQQLRTHTDAAIAAGVFGVPTFEVDGRLFWGQDALPMLRAYLDGDTWFESGAWEAASRVGAGVVRTR